VKKSHLLNILGVAFHTRICHIEYGNAVGAFQNPNRKVKKMADKKVSICKKVYVDKDGNETRSAHPDAVALEFRFTNGH